MKLQDVEMRDPIREPGSNSRYSYFAMGTRGITSIELREGFICLSTKLGLRTVPLSNVCYFTPAINDVKPEAKPKSAA